MSVLETIAGLLAPFDCIGCNAEGALICFDCVNYLPLDAPRCNRCHQPELNGMTCRACRATTDLIAVQSATNYEGVGKQIIWRLKSSGAQAAAQEMATLMARRCVLQYRKSTASYIVPVPTATSRVRQRGYDQSVLLARQLSRQTGLPYVRWLGRQGQAHQVGASRQQRLQQLSGAFRARQSARLQGAGIILVDDVLTTGATLEAAAKVLMAAGAERVEAVVFARA